TPRRWAGGPPAMLTSSPGTARPERRGRDRRRGHPPHGRTLWPDHAVHDPDVCPRPEGPGDGAPARGCTREAKGCARGRSPHHRPAGPSAGAASPDGWGDLVNPIVSAISGRLSLRPPQRTALEVLARVLERARPAKGTDVGIALEAVRAEFPTV